MAAVSPWLNSILSQGDDDGVEERVVVMPDFARSELESALDSIYRRLVGHGEVTGEVTDEDTRERSVGEEVLKCLGIDLDNFRFDPPVNLERKVLKEDSRPKRNIDAGIHRHWLPFYIICLA